VLRQAQHERLTGLLSNNSIVPLAPRASVEAQAALRQKPSGRNVSTIEHDNAKLLMTEEERRMNPTRKTLTQAEINNVLWRACDTFRAAQQKGEPFDVIFLDIVMPGVDGHEILVRIREWEAKNLKPDEERTKVVMVSAMKDTRNIFASVREGCDEYMTKPIRRQGVIDVMEKLGHPDPG